MASLVASLVLAALLPADFTDCAGVAAYWYKKDSRGKGDSISEQAKPRRFPAFALAEDTFILADPDVRAKHLDRIELWQDGRRYPAKEIFRGETPDTVMIKTEQPIPGIRPLRFAKGEPVERLTWGWKEDTLTVGAAAVGTNANVRIELGTRRAIHEGTKDSVLLDKDRNPVALDLGEFSIVEGDRFVYPDIVGRCTLPADVFEKAAAAVESGCVRAVLPIVIKLEQLDKTSRRRYSWENESAATEFDALGLVVAGKVLAPIGMTGEDIARFKCAEATFGDGTKANLAFVGALAEWNAIVFALPAGSAEKVASLSVCTDDPNSMIGGRAWRVSVENEAGRPVADAVRSRFFGVSFLRGAKFAAAAYDHARSGSYSYSSSDREKVRLDFVMTGASAVSSMVLKRRYGGRYSYNEESICPADLAEALAGRAFNPEFCPRAEDDRNRIVWLGVESVELTDALAREKNVQSFTERYSRPPLVTEVYPDSPCAKAGIRSGDILLAYRRGAEEEKRIRHGGDYSGRDWSMYFGNEEMFSYYGITATPWTDVESDTNRELSNFGVGAKITLVYVRDGRRVETEITLSAAPPHYKNAPKSRNRALGTLVKDMTFEVRRFFKFDDAAPGVVIAKVKPGSPAAVAGLMPYELVTEVNGEKVTGAHDFAAKVKGKADLVMSVRRLAQTRIVKIHVDLEAEKEKK